MTAQNRMPVPSPNREQKRTTYQRRGGERECASRFDFDDADRFVLWRVTLLRGKQAKPSVVVHAQHSEISRPGGEPVSKVGSGRARIGRIAADRVKLDDRYAHYEMICQEPSQIIGTEKLSSLKYYNLCPVELGFCGEGGEEFLGQQ